MIPDCDGQTVGWSDGRTESIMAKTALCIASYADALSKIQSVRSIYDININKLSHLVTCRRTQTYKFVTLYGFMQKIVSYSNHTDHIVITIILLLIRLKADTNSSM